MLVINLLGGRLCLLIGRKGGSEVATESRDFTFRETWAKACKAAGVPGLLFHDLRRTAARNLRRAGIAEGVIQRIGGWKTRSVFERYAIVTRTDIADAMRKLEAHEREHVTENGHVSGHGDARVRQVAKPESIN